MTVEACFETLLTGLAVRYYNAVAALEDKFVRRATFRATWVSPVVGSAVTSRPFITRPLFYEGDDSSSTAPRPSCMRASTRGEPVLVMVGLRKLELLRDALGERAADVHFADMEVVGRNPARIIPAWSRFVADHAGGGGRHARHRRADLGRPDAGRAVECQLHESLINLAFAAADEFRLICPYDTAALPDDVIAEARRSHPVVSHGRRRRRRRLLRASRRSPRASRAAGRAAGGGRGAAGRRSTACATRAARAEAGLGGRARRPLGRLRARGERGALEQPLPRARERRAAHLARRRRLVCEVRDSGTSPSR